MASASDPTPETSQTTSKNDGDGASVPTPKRNCDDASGDVDDASVPDPKRTCNNNSNVDDISDEEEKIIKSLNENPSLVLTLARLMSCDACKSLARGPIRYCGQIHKICSLCFIEGDESCPTGGCTEKLMLKTFWATQFTEAISAMKLPLPCINCKNGCSEKGEEKELKEHEIECEFRIVSSKILKVSCDKKPSMFKDLLCAMKSKVEKRGGKWKVWKSRSWTGEGKNLAANDFIGPDGLIFRILVIICPEPQVEVYAFVIGGERVASKYRVELRLSSNEKDFSHTHHGPVFSADTREPWNREELYRIDKKIFALFNKGVNYFGEHNEQENGELNIPIMMKIIKKELIIPKEEPGTPVDMDVEDEYTHTEFYLKTN